MDIKESIFSPSVTSSSNVPLNHKPILLNGYTVKESIFSPSVTSSSNVPFTWEKHHWISLLPETTHTKVNLDTGNR